MQVRVLDATAGASGIHRHDRSDTQILDKTIELQWWLVLSMRFYADKADVHLQENASSDSWAFAQIPCRIC